MKRTTYIFIGVFCANLVLALGFGIYIKAVLLDGDAQPYRFDLAQSPAQVDLNDIHTLEFTADEIDPERFYFSNLGRVLLTSAGDGAGSPVMSYPVSDYIKLDKKDGVLTVRLELPLKEVQGRRAQGVALDNLSFDITAAKSLTRIYSTRGFDIILNRVKLDSLCLESENSRLDSCIIRSLVLDSHTRFKGESSQLDDLYIDLDKVGRWDIKESTINTLHLTGSSRHQNRLSADQYNRLLWEPKTGEAELKITLKGKSQIITN